MSILVGATSGLAGAAGAAGGGGDLGDTIEQSVRFDGTQRLTRTFANNSGNTWTWSAWLKKTSNATRDQLIFGTASPLQFTMARSNNFGWTQSSVANFESGQRRDPSAWYHRVDVSNGTNLKMYINGDLVTTWSQASTGVNTNVEHFLGGDFANRSSEMWDGYIAQVYFIDGTAIGDTNGVIDEFGKINEDGVWVPQDYTGTFGNNGFHLDFADSSDLGNDVSGNNNDWTASGFDEISLSQRAHQVFGDNTSTYDTNNTNKIFLAPPDASSIFGPSRMFDGDLVNTQCKSGTGTAQTWIYYRPDPALSVSSSLGITCSQTQAIRVNGVDQGLSNTSRSTLNVSSPPASVTEIAIQGNTISSATVFGITVDGTVLTENLANDIDYEDTPTSNYATYNPLINNDEPTFDQANLDADSFNNGIAWASQELPNEHLYCEFVKTTGDHFAAGVWDAEDKFEKGSASDNDYAFGIVYSEFADQYRIFNENTTATQTGLARYYTGGILGVEWRGDLATRQVNFYIDGTQVGSSENVASGGRYYFGVHRAGGSAASSVEVNFGQRPFIAAPTGVTNTTHGMQTNNLPEPTIKNGSDHFRALTGTGANILGIAQGTNTNGTNWNDDVDTGFTNALWWIKDRDNTNQHQLLWAGGGSSVITLPDVSKPDDTSYSAPSGNSVAWCWNAPDTWASTDSGVTAGTIASSGYRNGDAGFSIVNWSGTGTAGSIGHALGIDIDMIIVTSTNATGGVSRFLWHSSLSPADQQLYLQNNDAATNTPDLWDTGTFNSNTFSVGTNQHTNSSGNNYVAFCWGAVSGYSDFGSYTGLGNADGAFVYTGFRPAYVLIKLAGASGGSWSLHDSTRDTHNPADTDISFNSAGAEGLNSFTQIDLLSNGFKIRGESGTTGQLNQQLVYAAFAESPFGGENAPPATAH